ncbi:carboxymuconolactone decarboxylase family protein [Neisseria sp. Ec49-e6-T10]|uniref:carboxymuconolactone decarboxylase family protein n=1 Tax=Neisseria sp. Ec49-e6-T10 TaxID=3140744 RepID=UPI003EBFB176
MKIISRYLTAFIFSGLTICTHGYSYSETVISNTSGESRLERGKRMLQVIDGEAGEKVIASLEDIAPDFATYIFEYPFADVYSRPQLNLRDRELATISMLTAMGTATPQLKVHIEAGLNVGLTQTEIIEVMIQASVYAGFPSTLNGLAAAKEVFSEHNKKVFK